MIGTDYSFDFAKNKFGLHTLIERYVDENGVVHSDNNYAPLAMGAQTWGVTVRDMACAFATYANNGVYREARTYTKVYNSKGELILENTQDSQEILSEKSVDYMNYCLDNAVNIGTGSGADIKGQDVAGKTGTTSSQKDRWFCGFTGYYTAAVWCGYNDPEVITLLDSTVNPASLLFKKVMEPVHTNLPRKPLYNTSKMRNVDICVDCGNLATNACNLDARVFNTGTKRTETISLYVEDIPVETCKCHVMMDFCETCNAVANEYCKQFAAVGVCKVSKRSLYKMTKKGVDDLASAYSNGLMLVHASDNYIYLVDEKGNPLNNYHGILGKTNQGISAPYQVCNVHTKAQWDAYLTTGEIPKADQPVIEEETKPTE
jgi:membrane peptidoglycan carboxypeptidase